MNNFFAVGLKLLIISVVLLSVCFSGLYAQTADDYVFAEDAIKGLNRQFESFPAEKIFLRTDKSAYAAEDTVWIKAWVQNGSLLTPTKNSVRLYMELIDPDGEVIKKALCLLDNGETDMEFILPEHIKERRPYRLRAYTPRMAAYFDPSYVYTFEFPVTTKNLYGEELREVNGSLLKPGEALYEKPMLTNRQKEVAREQEMLRLAEEEKQWKEKKESGAAERIRNIDLQFLPEGGAWVEGIPSRMAFKAVASDGYSIEVEGTITDDSGAEWGSFKSLHKGMGIVFLTPLEGVNYKAKLFNGQIIDLPKPLKSGITLQYNGIVNDSLDVRILASPDIVRAGGITAELITQARGVFAISVPVKIMGISTKVRLPEKELLPGITRLSLFGEDGSVISERQIWIDKDDDLRYDIKTSVKNDTVGGRQLTINVSSKSSSGEPVPSAFCISVTSPERAINPKEGESLKTRMLLTSDLKGEVEEPGWYFDMEYPQRRERLDLVMLTHGWSGFGWKELVSKTADDFKDNWPLTSTVTGKVTNISNKGIEKTSVTLFARDRYDRFTVMGAETDSSGRFRFDNLVFGEVGTLRFQAFNKRGRAFNVGIEIDPQPEDIVKPEIATLRDRLDRSYIDSLLLTFQKSRLKAAGESDSVYTLAGINVIKGVTITASYKVHKLFGRPFAGFFVDQTTIEKRYDPNATLLDVLKKEVPKFHVKRGYPPDPRTMVNLKNFRNLYTAPKLYSDDSWGKNRKSTLEDIIGDKKDDIWRKNEVPIPKNIMGDMYAVNNTYAFMFVDNVWLQEWDGERISVAAKSSPELLETAITTEFVNIFRDHTDALNSILAVDILGLTVDEKPDKGAIIDVRTKSGRGPFINSIPGVAYSRVAGYNTSRIFYVPKYYPKDDIDRLDYDFLATYYWNPEIITDLDGEAEITVPVGFWLNKELRVMIEGTDRAGHLGQFRKEIPLK